MKLYFIKIGGYRYINKELYYNLIMNVFRFNEMFDQPCSNSNKLKKIKHIKKKRIPWIEKYRPNKLDEVIHQTEIKKMLKETLVSGNLPHLLFYGPSGTGKTSTILAICKELFGPKKFNERVIELNASDERGINIVRKKIISFAKMATGNRDENYLCPPYKVIILDEADAMTQEAQSALRKIMEDTSNITRFCFICNYINQIIQPISSRCSKFKFNPLGKEHMIEKLKEISKKEQIKMSDDNLYQIIEFSEGDMRKAIMMLQNTKYLTKYTKNIDKKNIYEIANYIHIDKLINIWENYILNDDVGIKNILNIAREIRDYAYPINNILKQVSQLVLNDDNLTDYKKAKIFIFLGNMQKKLVDGSDEYIQLLSMLSYIKRVCLEKDI